MKQPSAPKSRQPFNTERQLPWPERSGGAGKPRAELRSIHLRREGAGPARGRPCCPRPARLRSRRGHQTVPRSARTASNRLPSARVSSCSDFPPRKKTSHPLGGWGQFVKALSLPFPICKNWKCTERENTLFLLKQTRLCG